MQRTVLLAILTLFYSTFLFANITEFDVPTLIMETILGLPAIDSLLDKESTQDLLNALVYEKLFDFPEDKKTSFIKEYLINFKTFFA